MVSRQPVYLCQAINSKSTLLSSLGVSAQKASSEAANMAASDCLLEYYFEGQGSAAGSVGCCSLQGPDEDLQFLDDLGPKFKTLAEICSPPRPATPQTHPTHTTIIPNVNEVQRVDELSLGAKSLGNHPKSPARIQDVSTGQSSSRVTGSGGAASSRMREQSLFSTSSRARAANVSPVIKATVPPPGQILLLQQQQPVYYTSTSVLQPVQYTVQPQPQVLLAEAPASNLQGMILLNQMFGSTEHIVPGGNTSATWTLTRPRVDRVLGEIQGVGALSRSDAPAVGVGVWRGGRRIKSAGGAETEHRDMETMMGGNIRVGSTGSEEEQVVFTRRTTEMRSESTASAEGSIAH